MPLRPLRCRLACVAASIIRAGSIRVVDPAGQVGGSGALGAEAIPQIIRREEGRRGRGGPTLPTDLAAFVTR